ncbi:MAG: hypothetical protein AAGA69_10040 [Pseudomonadota bacterium]
MTENAKSSKEFRQKRLANRTSFDFEAETLAVSVEDSSAAVDFKVRYEDIPFEARNVGEKMQPLYGATFFFLFMAALVTIFMAMDLSLWFTSIRPVGFLLLAGLCWFGYQRTNVHFTVYDTPQGSIWIIKDDQHDQIVQLIEERRKDDLRARLFEMESNEMMATEKALEWLFSNGVITSREYEDRMARLGSMQTDTDQTPPRLLN